MKILKISLVVLVSLLIAGYIALRIMSEPLPKSEQNGDDLARKIEIAISKPAFDSLPFIGWNFNNYHYYIWNKRENKAIVHWSNIKVYLILDKVDGKVFKDGKEITSNFQRKRYIKKAWKYWCNDSFWVFAPYKLFDKGTKRSLVRTSDGNEALLVQYESGGVTPGDAYLWKVDKNYRPTAFKLWVGIIPLKGLEASWDQWVSGKSGAQYSTAHKIVSYTSRVYDVVEGSDWSDYYEEWKE